MGRCGWIIEQCDVCKAGNGLFQNLQTLCVRIRHEYGRTGKIASGSRKAGHMSATNRVGMGCEYDRYDRCRSLGSLSVDRSGSDDYVDVHAHEIVGKLRQALEPPLCPAEFDCDVFTFDPTQVTEPLTKGSESPFGKSVCAGVLFGAWL